MGKRTSPYIVSQSFYQRGEHRFWKLLVASLVLSFVVLSTITLPIHAQLADSSWPMFQHDPQHTGGSPYVGPQTNNLKWKYTLGGSLSPLAIGSDDTIYLGSTDGDLYAINTDGTPKWNYLTDSYISLSSPAISLDGTICVGAFYGKLYVINPDGILEWSYQTCETINDLFPVAIGYDGAIYVVAQGHKLYAINPDGTLKWSYPTNTNIYGLYPVIGQDGTIYTGDYDKLYAINPDGTLKWSYQTQAQEGGAISSQSPAIAPDGTIYIEVATGGMEYSSDIEIHAINPDGTLKWIYRTGLPQGVGSLAIGPDGTIYSIPQGRVYAINPDGTLKWSYPDAYGRALIIGSDRTVYVGGNSDKFNAIGYDGTLKWSYYLGAFATNAAIGSDGVLYVVTLDGNLYAFGPVIPANQPPTASFTYSPQNPVVGEEITFDSSSSTDPDGEIVSYEWDWDNDEAYDESITSPTTTHSWNEEGTYQVRLRVTDNDGATDSISKQVTIAPLDSVDLVSIVPPAGTTLHRGTSVPFEVTVFYNLTSVAGGFVGAELGDGTGKAVIIGDKVNVGQGSGTTTINGSIDVDFLYEIMQVDTVYLALSLGYWQDPTHFIVLVWKHMPDYPYLIGTTTGIQVDVDTKYFEAGNYQLRITTQASPGDVSSITITGPGWLDTATVNKPGDPESSDNPKQLYDDGQHWDGEANDGQWQVVLNIPATPNTSDTITFHVTYSDDSTETKQKTIDGVFTETPTLVSPSDGSTINTLTPTFEWTGLSVPVNHHTLQISGVYDIFTISGDVISYPLPSEYLSWDKTYDWLVSASDANGNEALTNYDTFTTHQLTLLEKYAPVLYLHPDEQYYPWGIESMLDKGELWEIILGIPYEIANMPVTVEQLGVSNTSWSYLNLEGYSPSGPIPTKELWENDPEYSGKYFIYGREYESPGAFILQYWFFYPFNDWDTGTFIKGNVHEGDWEMIQVVYLKNTENPGALTYAHHHSGTSYNWDEVSKIEETYPKVFVAKGSHGSWGDNVEHNVGEINPLNDLTSENGTALYPKGVDPSSIQGPTSKAQYTLVPISDETSWVNWLGKWGDIYLLPPGFKGPESPGEQDKWNNPVEWGLNPPQSWYWAWLGSPGHLHVYDSYGNHVGWTETSEIEANIPGTYLYAPSSYSETSQDLVWIYTSEDLRFVIEGTNSGSFDFILNMNLEEKNLSLGVAYENVEITENTIATVDVTTQNPGFIMEIDIDGDEVIDEVKYPNYIENLVADIQATIDIDPDVLNLKSKGKWITSYIELPNGYDVNNVDIDTILLMINEGVVTEVAESSHTEINDYDKDNIPDLMVKFDRATLITYLKDHNLISGQVTLRVIGQVNNKIFEGTDIITIKGGEASKTEEAVAQSKFSLSQNYPNPFNPQTTIQYSLAEGCHVMLKIYNIAGQLIKILINEYQQAGSYTIIWHGDNDVGEEVARGLYFYQLQAGDFVSTKKMVVLK